MQRVAGVIKMRRSSETRDQSALTSPTATRAVTSQVGIRACEWTIPSSRLPTLMRSGHKDSTLSHLPLRGQRRNDPKWFHRLPVSPIGFRQWTPERRFSLRVIAIRVNAKSVAPSRAATLWLKMPRESITKRRTNMELSDGPVTLALGSHFDLSNYSVAFLAARRERPRGCEGRTPAACKMGIWRRAFGPPSSSAGKTPERL